MMCIFFNGLVVRSTERRGASHSLHDCTAPYQLICTIFSLLQIRLVLQKGIHKLAGMDIEANTVKISGQYELYKNNRYDELILFLMQDSLVSFYCSPM